MASNRTKIVFVACDGMWFSVQQFEMIWRNCVCVCICARWRLACCDIMRRCGRLHLLWWYYSHISVIFSSLLVQIRPLGCIFLSLSPRSSWRITSTQLTKWREMRFFCRSIFRAHIKYNRQQHWSLFRRRFASNNGVTSNREMSSNQVTLTGEERRKSIECSTIPIWKSFNENKCSKCG